MSEETKAAMTALQTWLAREIRAAVRRGKVARLCGLLPAFWRGRRLLRRA